MFFLNVSVDVCRFFKLLCSFFLSCWWAIAIVRFLVKFFCLTYYLSIFHFHPTLIFPRHGNKVLTCITVFSGLGICSSVFWANQSFFAKNELIMSKWAICSKKPAIHSFAHFLVSDLSKSLMVIHFWWANWVICSHHSLKKKEGTNHSFF